MFGHKWEPATAKIVAKKFKEATEAAGVYEYVADITPATGAMFRATLRQPPFMNHVVRLEEGAEVQAFADVRRQKAKFDRADPRVSGKGSKPGRQRFEEALADPPGTPPPSKQQPT
jgi:hypothetical protein